MFTVVGNKKKIKTAIYDFVNQLNEQMGEMFVEDISDDMVEETNSKLPFKVDKDTIKQKIMDKIPIQNVRFGVEEREDGYEIVAPVLSSLADKKFFGTFFKMMIGKSRDSLDTFMSRNYYCPNCEKAVRVDEVGDTLEKCPDCDSENIEKIEYEIK